MSEEQAAAIVEAIINDMTDRRGLRHAWDDIDEDVQQEIRLAWFKIILLCVNGPKERAP